MSDPKVDLLVWLDSKIWDRTAHLMDSQLPVYPHMPNVVIPIDTVKRFRQNYSVVAGFAATVMEVPIETMCVADMMAYLAKKAGNK